MSTGMSSDLDVDHLISQLQSIRNSSTIANEEQRQRLREALSRATLRVEQPEETIYRIISTQPSLAAVLKVCEDIHLFEKWAAVENDLFFTPSLSDVLAQATKIDKSLLNRIIRHLTALHVVERKGGGYYELSEFARALARPEINCMIDFMYNTTLPGYQNLPTFLSHIDYSDPKKSSQTNWTHLRGIPRFEDLKTRPDELANFQTVMAANVTFKTPWTHLFPPDFLLEIRTKQLTPKSALFVDVGGGAGYDGEKLWSWIQEHAPDKMQSLDQLLILQDLPEQLARVSVSLSIRKMAYDFFTAQPVKGAAAYYLHTVLHDWPDEKAVAILDNVAEAATPWVSRILIHETVVTDPPTALSTSLDIHMMMVHGSAERSEGHWRAIVAAAGLKVLKIWSKPGTTESVIEAVKLGLITDPNAC